MTPLGIAHDGLIVWDHDTDSYCLHTEKIQKPNTWKYTLLRRPKWIGNWVPVETKEGFTGWNVADTGLDREVGHGFAGAVAILDFHTGLAVRRKTGIDYCTLG